METRRKMKLSTSDKVLLGFGYAVLGIFVLAILIPLVYVVVASFMDPNVLNSQGISFNFKDWTLDAYRRVLENEMIWRGFLNSFFYSTAFTVISVFVTLLAAYPMSKKEFVGRKFFNTVFIITMFFGGGLIPTFILVNQLHMVNTVWAILLPGAFNVWNMILARTYYQSIPKELREASAIDGANEIQHFFRIMLPVCKPIIAVLALWSFVGMWNSYFDAMIYLNDANLQPLQLVLRSILVQNTPQPGMIADIQSTAEMAKVAELSFITSAPATSTQEPNERTIFKRLEKQTNVHIDWTCFVADQFADKKNLALAQFGNLPDGLFNAGMNDYDLLRYAKQGIIIPVEHLIDKYMPNLKAIFEKYPEYRTMCTAPDGHIYSFPWIEQLGEGKEAIQAIGNIPYINKKWLDFLGLKVPETTEELEKVLIAFRDHAEELKSEFDIEGDVIPMSFIINNGDQDPAILINGFGEGYGDTGDHFAVTDEGKVIYTTVQEGYKEGIQWLHELVEQKLVDPEAFTQEWSTYVAKGKSHRYGLCFTWDISNIDNYEDYVMLPALAGPNGLVNITRQNNSETSGFDRGRCVLTTSCKNTALAAAWIDQMYAPLQSPQNNWGTYGEKDSFNIFEMGTNKDGEKMLKHMDLGNESPVEVREAQSVNGPLAVLNEYYDVYVTQPADAKWRLDNMHETYLEDMHSKYVYPNVFMSIEDTNKVTQYDTDIRKYAEQKKADWILNGGIEKEWDSYLKKMEQYGLSDYLAIKQKYFDKYQESLKSEQGKE